MECWLFEQRDVNSLSPVVGVKWGRGGLLGIGQGEGQGQEWMSQKGWGVAFWGMGCGYGAGTRFEQ